MSPPCIPNENHSERVYKIELNLPAGVDNNCRAVTHRLMQKGGRDQEIQFSGLSVYLIHSLPLGLSAVQVRGGFLKNFLAHCLNKISEAC